MLAVSSAGLCWSLCVSCSLLMSELVLCEKRIMMCALGAGAWFLPQVPWFLPLG